MTFRICHVISSLRLGGAQQLLRTLCLETGDSKFEHVVINLTEDTDLAVVLRNRGIKVHSLGLSNFFSGIAGIWRLRRTLIREKPHLVHSWLYHADFMTALSMAGNKPCPLIWSVHHASENFEGDKTTTRWFVKMLSLFSRRFPVMIIFCSDYAKKVHQKLGYNPARSLVINNGIDTRRFSPSAKLRNRFREQNNLNDSMPVIGMVARFSPVKGHRVFLEMARDLAKQNSDVRFVMLGTDIDEANSKLNQTIKEYGLRDRCLLLGEITDVETALNGMDVLICPSYSESFGLVVVEALACAVPVVCSDLEVLRMLVGDEYSIPIGDASAFVDKVGELIRMSDESRKEVGFKGRERIVREFDIGIMIERYKDVYREFCMASKLDDRIN